MSLCGLNYTFTFDHKTFTHTVKSGDFLKYMLHIWPMLLQSAQACGFLRFPLCRSSLIFPPAFKLQLKSWCF